MEHYLPLVILPGRYAVCRLPTHAPTPEWAQEGDLIVIVRTRDELSLVCDERFVPPEAKAERGWRAIQVQGQLDFALVGVMAAVALPLAEAGISLFALSTFDTDYFLVKQSALERAIQALEVAGHQILNPERLE